GTSGPEALAGRRRGVRPGSTEPCARPHGHRGADPNVVQAFLPDTAGREPRTTAKHMPIIGVTNCRKLEDYRQSVLHVGGEVRVLDAAADVAGAMTGLDGLLLTGGGDVDPSRYGEARHDTFSPTVDAGRDDFELALLAIARERQRAVLAICRGIQVLNVARGGTLVQDIPSQVPGALSHQLEV